MASTALPAPGLRARARAFFEEPRVERIVMVVIIVNAIVLGLETSPAVMAAIGPLLRVVDKLCLAFFVAELAVRVWAHGPRFFTRAWNNFDFIVVAIALVPASNGLQVLRALRVLRVLRLISIVPEMRRVVEALLKALPGMGTVMALMALVFYVFAVMTTMLFGQSFPDWFGNLAKSAYSLFQIMTLESWSMGIVRPVMEVYPYAWAIFVPFILATTFAVLNLFVAIVVNAMQAGHEEEHKAEVADQRALLAEIRELRRELAALKSARLPAE